MKKLTLLLLVSSLLFLVNSSFAFAQDETTDTPTPKSTTSKVIPSPTPTATPEKSKIDELKEKIASTVAQLNLVSKKAFVGPVSKLEKAQITIDAFGQSEIIDVDELTKYYTEDKNGKRVDGRGSDVTIGENIVAIGLYNKDSRKLLGRIIMVKNSAINVSGTVKEVDIKGGTVTLEDKKNSKTYTIDIEKDTLIRLYNEGTLSKSGLSKIEIGMRAHINGLPDTTEESQLSANRIFLLPGKVSTTITQAPAKQASASATPTEKPVKTTATPKPTKKPTPTPTETP